MSGIIMLERQDQHRCKADGGVIGTSVDNPSEFAVAPFFGATPPSSGLYDGQLRIDSSARPSSPTINTPPYEMRRWNAGGSVWELIGYVPFTGLGVGHSTGLVPDPGDGSGGALATNYLGRDSTWHALPTDDDSGGGGTAGPGVRRNIGGAQLIPTATETLVGFQYLNYCSPDYPTLSWYDVAHYQRIVAPVDGLYAIDAHVAWDIPGATNKICRATILWHGLCSNDSVVRTIAIRRDQKAFLAGLFFTTLDTSTQWMLAAGEYIELSVWQNTGLSVNILSDAGADSLFGAMYTHIMMTKIAEYAAPNVTQSELPE